jgi:hypothetical protein
MFKNNVESIKAQKTKAFAIFVKTKEDLLKAMNSAYEMIMDNEDQIKKLEAENRELFDHRAEMDESVKQICGIIGG